MKLDALNQHLSGGVGYAFGFPTAWCLVTAWLTASWLAGMLLERMGAP
jgi:hypothetical protein